MSKQSRVNRGRFCGAAAATVAAGSLGLLGSPERSKARTEVAQQTDSDATAIRPFRVNIPQAQLTDLRRRINATKWPDRETVNDESQGVQLATMQGLSRYWGSVYNWRKFEAKFNTYPQFITEIDGVDIHFIHARSKHTSALPMIMTHGWPGSLAELLKVIGPLTDPTAHGGKAEDAFHLVLPHIPGFGFSGKPRTTGWDPDHIARAWVVLMKRLGYSKFVAQGGDWGGIITNLMGEQAAPELLGIHVNFNQTVPPDILRALRCGDPPPAGLSPDELRAYNQIATLYKTGIGYAIMMGTRPQTLYALADSPVGLAAWIYDKFEAWTDTGGHPERELTRDEMLDDITLYWLTNTAISSARIYWENKAPIQAAVNVSIPAAVSEFPGENYVSPRSWTERAYHKLIYYHKANKGGHFAAWEQPQLFSEEVRAGLRPLRASS